jgi:tetratricopeptide (TPR) repeat protein
MLFSVCAGRRGGVQHDLELQARATYWDRHGRADLAEKGRSRIRQVSAPAVKAESLVSVKPAAPVVIPPPAEIRPTVVAATPLSQSQASAKPDIVKSEDTAQYWESRGRSDLAQKARGEPKVIPVTVQTPVQTKIVNFAPNGSEAMPVVKPTREAQVDSAQYWESRGRGDLAAQIRKKLGTPPSNGRRETVNSGGTDNQLRSAGSDNQARSELEDSLLKNSDSLKSRLDLAQLYQGAGEFSRARVQIDSVLLNNPDLPAALFASAQLYAEQHLWMEAMHTLERISPVSRTLEMARLQKTSWAHLQLDRADALVRQGKHADAELLLRQVAVELAINVSAAQTAEPPPLWNSASTRKRKRRR